MSDQQRVKRVRDSLALVARLVFGPIGTRARELQGEVLRDPSDSTLSKAETFIKNKGQS